MRALLNPSADRTSSWRGLLADEEYRDVHGYFAAHPELSPTPLTTLRRLADTLGIAAVDAKDETARFGVNAFKICGVRYAVHRLGDSRATRGLVCATAGNHGRAVARVAARKHLPCTVFLPAARTSSPAEAATRASRISAMADDGATVVEVDGTYEEAVRQAVRFGEASGATIVSDTSWPGYDEIPRWIMAGYTQLFEECLTQWDAMPTIVVVQGGVGGLVCAAANWFAWRFNEKRPFLVAAEPDSAACLLASAEAGRPVTIDSDLDTIMAGLRCAEPSPAAWPSIAAGVDAFVTVPDSLVLEAMAFMGSSADDQRITAGPSGACGVAALLSLAHAPELATVREAAGWGSTTRALAVVTEGL